MALTTQEFYDRLAYDYHLIFASWDEAVHEQGNILDRLLRANMKRDRLWILDCSCGIGTQAVGLALCGHKLTATDLSSRSVQRAKKEAERLGVEISFGTADFRALEGSVEGVFDAVVSFDNTLSHMMSREDLLSAARSIRSKVRKGGVFLASIRDYDELLKERPGTTTPKVIDTPEGRRIYFQVWDWEEDGRAYVFNLFLLSEEDEGWQTVHQGARYRAILRGELRDVLEEAGFSDIRWEMPGQSGYYQPVVIARG